MWTFALQKYNAILTQKKYFPVIFVWGMKRNTGWEVRGLPTVCVYCTVQYSTVQHSTVCVYISSACHLSYWVAGKYRRSKITYLRLEQQTYWMLGRLSLNIKWANPKMFFCRKLNCSFPLLMKPSLVLKLLQHACQSGLNEITLIYVALLISTETETWSLIYFSFSFFFPKKK